MQTRVYTSLVVVSTFNLIILCYILTTSVPLLVFVHVLHESHVDIVYKQSPPRF